MKKVEGFYQAISNILRAEHPDLFKELNGRIDKDDPKQVFIWLQSELEQRSISNDLDSVMTDFFYSIH